MNLMEWMLVCTIAGGTVVKTALMVWWTIRATRKHIPGKDGGKNA